MSLEEILTLLGKLVSLGAALFALLRQGARLWRDLSKLR